MAQYSVSITYVLPDVNTSYWLGGEDATYLDYVLTNYITPGKILNEYVEHASPTQKTFVRVFDSQASWIEFRDDPNRSAVNADREAYCLANNITVTRTEVELTT